MTKNLTVTKVSEERMPITWETLGAPTTPAPSTPTVPAPEHPEPETDPDSPHRDPVKPGTFPDPARKPCGVPDSPNCPTP